LLNRASFCPAASRFPVPSSVRGEGAALCDDPALRPVKTTVEEPFLNSTAECAGEHERQKRD